MPTGLLLVNLGTPDEPSTPAVRRYLAQFLADPRVLDMNPVGRWLLLHAIILRTRPAKSAHAYQQIWSKRGSPLLFHSLDLVAAVRERLGPTWAVELGMRYGNPSIASGLDKLQAAGCERLVVFPLYPQYSSAGGGSTLEEVMRVVAAQWVVPDVSTVGPFYADPDFVKAFADVGAPILAAERPDHVLMSFHGLPERHMRKAVPPGSECLAVADCCASIRADNRHCYRAQCYATARAMAAALGLGEDKYSVCFQSRLGGDPWIRPYTDERIVELGKAGHKRVCVFCPAFVADCLETLEEIGMRADADFRAAGGEKVTLVPSLNSHPSWVSAVVKLVTASAPPASSP
jgi:protoporphyrin/coproporphyrin ferrochelatase